MEDSPCRTDQPTDDATDPCFQTRSRGKILAAQCVGCPGMGRRDCEETAMRVVRAATGMDVSGRGEVHPVVGYEKIEKRILEHERNAHQKKGKAKADEAEMDLPALAGKDGGEAAGKGDKNQERTGKKHLAANQKANQAAAKAMPLLASSLQAMEKMESKLPQIAGEEGYEDICKTFRETKEKLVAWSTAARQTLAEYDRTKNDAPATMSLIPALPFSLPEVKTLTQKEKYVVKSVKSQLPMPKAKAKAKTAEREPKRRRRDKQPE